MDKAGRVGECVRRQGEVLLFLKRYFSDRVSVLVMVENIREEWRSMEKGMGELEKQGEGGREN